MWKTYKQTIHPVYDRYLTYREFKLLMDIPTDFDDSDIKDDINKVNVFCQNVPAITAMDAVLQARLFIEGKLRFSNSDTTWLRDGKETLYISADCEPAGKHIVPDYFVCEANGSSLRCGLNPNG